MTQQNCALLEETAFANEEMANQAQQKPVAAISEISEKTKTEESKQGQNRRKGMMKEDGFEEFQKHEGG